MQLLTNSRRSCFNKCAKMYYYRYVLGFKPAKTADALRFGSLFHGVLEIYWLTGLEPALYWLEDQKETDYNVYEKEMAKQLIIGYDSHWQSDENTEDAIPEVEFRAPLINPATMRESRTFELGGKIDVVVPSRKRIVEHKTTSDDISPESDYWLKLTIDGQISGYYAGDEALGYECEECLYDAIRKPGLRPLQATPEDKRKYKKDGSLYANQRLLDESVEDYGKRLAIDIAERPERYFARKIVTRSEDDMVDYMTDMWGCARNIADNTRLNRWPRNPDECLRFGRCPYFGVCTKTESLDDTELFTYLENPDEELPSAKKDKEAA